MTRSAQIPDYTVGILEEDGNAPLATGSLVGGYAANDCGIAILSGRGSHAKVITHLLRVAAQKGVYH